MDREFDATTVSDAATYEDPQQPSRGIVRVFVNGIAVCEDGRATGARPGQVLPRGRAQAAEPLPRHVSRMPLV